MTEETRQRNTTSLYINYRDEMARSFAESINPYPRASNREKKLVPTIQHHKHRVVYKVIHDYFNKRSLGFVQSESARRTGVDTVMDSRTEPVAKGFRVIQPCAK